MHADRNKKILGGILGFFKLLYGLIWVVGAFTILVGIVIPLNVEVKDEFCRVPINFAMNDAQVSFTIGGTAYSTALSRTSGMLQVKDGPLLLAYVNILIILVVMAVILYCLRLAIRIVERVQEGKFFLLENALALRRIAVASVLLFLFFIALRVGFGLFASGRLSSGLLTHTGLLGSSLDFSLGDLALPLFLWALAEVFRAGVAMKEDHDLTI